MPKDKKLRVEIIWLYYDIPVAGHGERWKITELVIRNYWWSGVTKDVGKYMNSCNRCQRIYHKINYSLIYNI